MTTSASGKTSKAKARELKASGNKAMAAGGFQKALRQYSRALELDPGNAILYSNRSATHFNLRQFAESLEDAESAILCDEKWWKAYKRKGLALIHMQRYEEAIESLEMGLDIIGKNAEMEKNLEFAKACQEQAQNLYILPEPHMMSRLESVPVFIVTDDVGQPFFVTYEDGQQVCTFYFDKADADATLKWIQEENPDIGTSAQVIHITLNQAFSLAQETQKQYYEETTRAAVEEDLAAARESAEKNTGKPGQHEQALDVDGDEGDEDKEGSSDSDNSQEVGAVKDDGNDNSKGIIVGEIVGESQSEAQPSEVADTKSADVSENENLKDNPDVGDGNEVEGSANSNNENASDDAKKSALGDGADDDAAIDENAPLSFQFRPELRQVQVAVALLNKHPNPPVRPILRDPPSVKEAKARARAEAKAKAEAATKEDEVEPKASASEDQDGADRADEKGAEPVTRDGGEPAEQLDEEQKKETDGGGENVSANNIEKKDEVGGEDHDGAKEKHAPPGQGDGAPKPETKASSILTDDDDEEELTVENFNGIPVFHAKGLTLLQNGQQLFPLFCSKWDLEAAWEQLASPQGSGVSGKCEVEVGTLEDVLRRMSESKTGEFDNVIFVPSRESMAAIGQKFPLDDLASTKPAVKPVVRKANYSRAKQIKARGGTPEEIRAAIEEDLKVYRERQRMAEMVAQLNQNPLAEQGSSGLGRLGAGSNAAAALSRRAMASEKPLSGHDRRSLQREARSKASMGTLNAAAAAGRTSASSKARFSETTAPVDKRKAGAVAADSSAAEK